MTDGSFAQGLVGVTLDGRYRLDAVLGEGGMGSVFRATQLAMDRKVAVKLLKPHLTSDEAALQRFAREARATLRVDSPHAVKILDFGVTPQGDYYMVLEYLDGRTVHRELEIDGPFAPARVAHVARQALHALGAAHDQGLIHRDVKPDNLLLMRAGGDPDYTKVLDFGVAKLMQGAAGDPAQLALTAAGMVFGTPEFMSPEQACGQALDGRSDLYSLAATMFVMLTGQTLFEGKTAIELLTHHARTPAPHLAMVRPELAAYPELDQLLQRCLAKRREQRPENAAVMSALIGELAPTLSRALPAAASPAMPTPPTPPPVFHSSSYFHVLRDPAPSGVPGGPGAASAHVVQGARGPVTPSASLGGPGTESLVRAIHARRRRTLWLAGIVSACLLGGAIGLAMRAAPGPGVAANHEGRPVPTVVETHGAAAKARGAGDPGASGAGAGDRGTGPETAHPGVGPANTRTNGTDRGAGPLDPGTRGADPVGAGSPSSANPGAEPANAGLPASGNRSAEPVGSGRPSGNRAAEPNAVPPASGNRSAEPVGSGRPSGNRAAEPANAGHSVAAVSASRGAAPTEPGGSADGAVARPLSPSARKALAAEHVRNAEDAARTGKCLTQIIQADAAVRADPRNVRAKYLLGEGLTKCGDIRVGCNHLRALKRYQPARDQARAAGCTGD